jgi:hypothetical protein
MDAWDNTARVDIWEKVEPNDLLRMGLNFVRVAKQHGAEE